MQEKTIFVLLIIRRIVGMRRLALTHISLCLCLGFPPFMTPTAVVNGVPGYSELSKWSSSKIDERTWLWDHRPPPKPPLLSGMYEDWWNQRPLLFLEGILFRSLIPSIPDSWCPFLHKTLCYSLQLHCETSVEIPAVHFLQSHLQSTGNPQSSMNILLIRAAHILCWISGGQGKSWTNWSHAVLNRLGIGAGVV